MSIVGIDHVAIAVDNLDEAIENYDSLLDEEPRIEEVPEQGVRVAAFDLGDSRLELIEPIESGNSVSKFLDREGEGLHHLALRTDSINQELSRANDLGITCIDSEAREGADGYRIGFLHPKDLNGALLELAQPLIRVNK